MRQVLSVAVTALVVLSALALVAVPAGAATGPGDQSTHRSPSGVTAPTGQTSQTALADEHDACAPVASGSAPDDPASDRLGWENGCWYDEAIDVTPADGLNETELDAVVARAMARVEQVRQLEFEQSVPVEVISREEFVDRIGNGTTSTANRLHQNVKWEAMLMVGENTDAIAVQQSNTGAVVGGGYFPGEDRIVIVSENTTSPKMNEITLSQELFHALQEHRFNVSEYDQSTRELHNAKDGIIEGDGNLVDRLYQQRCEAEWSCLTPNQSSGGGGTGSIHFGMYLVSYQPYSDGPKFVRQIYRARGWEAVNAVYENPPASTEQTIHTEKYEQDPPTTVSFTDTSDAEWSIPDLGAGSVDYAQFGEAGLASMLFYPYYDSGRSQAPVIGIRTFFNLTASGQVSSFDPISYGNEFTAGWDGDRLYPYVTNESADNNQTAYVWKTVWDSEQDARQFVDGYTQLLDYYDASAVSGNANTYRLPEDSPYADAIYVNQTGTTVTLVNAPTVDQLDDVRAGAAPESTSTDTPTDTPSETPTDTPTDDPTPTDTPTATSEDGTTAPPTATPTTTGGGGPGFGVAVGLVALLAVAGAALRRRD